MANKYYITMLIIFLIVSPLQPIYAQGKGVLDDFLYSRDINVKQRSYRTIIENQKDFSIPILKELEKYTQDQTISKNVPNELIYIASLIRDKSYLPSLIKIIQFNEYSEDSCVYNCPIVFALTLFECFSDFSVPANLDVKNTPISDLYNGIKYAKKKSYLTDEKIRIASQSMKILYGKTLNLTTQQLIQQAGPQTKDYISRLVAVNVLANSIDSDRYMMDLYWLAITEANDTSASFRSEIYRAILKAEYYKSRK
jgi:hypothetical protein